MVGVINSHDKPNLADYYRHLEKRMGRIERGATSGNTSTDPAFLLLLTISGLSLSSQSVVVDQDNYKVYMRWTWTALSSDPSEYNKEGLDGYLTSYSLDGGSHWTADLFTSDNFLDVGPFAQSQSVTFRVRARTRKATLGPYTAVTNSTTADATAPFQPSTPVVSPYLGQLAIDWNGLDVSSGAMPSDFRFCEVHLATSGPTFTPSTTTLVGTIFRGGGTWVATGLTYGTLVYARLVAVDTVGNRSVSSTAGSGTPVQAANGDISSLAVGKLTAGVITAVMTITGRLATALTGIRVEMNSSGIQAFNSGGNQTLDVNASTGAVAIAGTLKTAFTGVRLEMTNASDRSTIEFYGTAAVDPAFINSPTDGAGAPRLGANSGPFTYNGASAKHRLFLNNAGGIQLETFRVSGGAADGGRLTLANDSAKLQVQDAGTVMSELAMFDDQSWWMSGKISASNVIGGFAFIYADVTTETFPSGGMGQAYTYGLTTDTTLWPICTVHFGGGGNYSCWVSAVSLTGFTLTTDAGAGSGHFNFWNFRRL